MDSESVLQSIGYIGIFISVFIECGVPLGLILPLPGWSLLFTAGVFAASGSLDLKISIAVGITAAVLGYLVGYFTGYKYGRKIFFEKQTKKYFTSEQGHRTEKFMKRFGYTTLIIGRFLPFVHNIVPILGGFARLPLLQFMIVNVIGATLWVVSAVLLGFYLGKSIPNSQLYVIPLVILTVIAINTTAGKKFVERLMAKIT